MDAMHRGMTDIERGGSTSRSNRMHIGVFGRVNAGKSSVINFITRQPASIVSDTPGTTTDPVLKNMELLPLGPVVFIDTPGFGDAGELGEKRMARARESVDRTDLALLAVAADDGEAVDQSIVDMLRSRGVPIVGVLTKIDLVGQDRVVDLRRGLEAKLGIKFTPISAEREIGRSELLDAMIALAPTDFERETLVGDIVSPGDSVLLVAPQDIQAPKGRLIMPQVQTLRDLLDHGAIPTICTTDMLPRALESLASQPDLVITDSQVFGRVASLLPRETRLTSFSILMARFKGDLASMVKGARAIAHLREDDRVLIAEACTHHELEGDIARQKLPAWLRERVGRGLRVDVVAGPTLPDDLPSYALVLHCGGCMFTRRQLLSRMLRFEEAGVPVTNYGTAIAAMNGILERTVEIFPEIAKGA